MGKKSKMSYADPSKVMEKYVNGATKESKKNLYKKYKDLLDDIEYAQFRGFELDKLAKKDTRRNINKKERDFYYGMESLKKRKKDVKRNSKGDGMLDRFMETVQQLMPVIKTCAKLVMVAIVSILSIDFIQKGISPKTLEKLTTVFQFAMAV